MANIIKTSQKDYYREKLLECKTDYKDIFSLMNKMLLRNEPLLLPLTTDIKAQAEEFKKYFHGKIEKIMDALQLKSTRITSNNIKTDFLRTERMGYTNYTRYRTHH